MNAAAKNMKPPESDTPEASLQTFESAEPSHSVFCQYGKATGIFYSVPSDIEIHQKSIGGWLAMPLSDSKGENIGIAHLSADRAQRAIFYPYAHIEGCVIFGKPEKDKPLFVVSSPEAAFAISLTGNACLLTFTPHDWGSKKSIEPKDAGNMTYVIKSWSLAGYKRLYVPCGCDVAATYQQWLKGLNVNVLAMVAPIDQYIPTAALKAELDALCDSDTPLHEEHEPDLETDLKRLASLSLIDYERCRDSEAKRLKVRATVLDKLIKPYKVDEKTEARGTDMFATVEPWEDTVDGVALLDEIASIIHRHIVCEKPTIHAATLWIAFSWCINVMHVSPIACITAPEKRCGKTQLLNLIGMLCMKPLSASSITAAALFRSIEAFEPTLLIDEADAFLGQNEELRGIINSGHTRQSAFVIRTVGDNHEPKKFSTWGAKAISGIGQLSPTLMDRSIILQLRRKQPNESRDRLRHADTSQFERVKRQLARWAIDNMEALKSARPTLPDALNDRAQDNWESLLTIADRVGGHWEKTARHTAMAISGIEDEAPSINEELLADIKHVFEKMRVSRISSVDLLERLCSDDEAPWATWAKGRPMTPRQLSRRLSDFGISSKTMRDGSGTFKGYELSDFKDAFDRYIKAATNSNDESVTRSQPSNSKAYSQNESVTSHANVTDRKPLEPLQTKACDRVTDRISTQSHDGINQQSETDNQGSLYL